MRINKGMTPAIAVMAMTIFRIIMGKVSPGWRTSRYMNRQMQDIFFFLFFFFFHNILIHPNTHLFSKRGADKKLCPKIDEKVNFFSPILLFSLHHVPIEASWESREYMAGGR